ncbi:hypothetical protein GIB67_004653 [Kingdonia uniflora]|uniref:Protein disulfide-isomerase n=1 Tax=Kingdonia uniflora TaxID=39325 RepID=A0A7J7MDI2_9MAGN|nr:hypothetical protein GIB67_004653 [Kingdonia uniflora]
MASKARVSICLSFIVLSLFVSSLTLISASEEEAKEFVLTLDSTNFTEVVGKSSFIVVEFYAPWCGHCKNLAPEYEKAAALLSSHDPPVILAKVDANEEINKELASEYDIKGFPTLKLIRDGGKDVQEYKGPREAEGIVEYLKSQAGPASAEIKSVEDAGNLIDDKKIIVVGLFPEFSGEAYENFSTVAKKLRSDYDFGHTLDAKLLPRGSAVSGPIIRLFKPFDELFVDFEDFHVDTLEKFLEEASVPLVTVFNKDPSNHPFVIKFFNTLNAKVMLFVNFDSDISDSYKSTIHDAAQQYKGKGVSFLIGDVEASQGAFQYFGLKEDMVPLIIIQTNDNQKYLKPNIEHPDHIAPWLKEYMDGNVKPYKKSEPIPEVNNEPVKIIVADTLEDLLNSGKNVLLEFYAPWCGHCKNLAPILDEVAVFFQNDPDVVIAKIDATANDLPADTFDVKGYPTMYFKSSSGELKQYDGGRTKEDIIEFLQQNQDKSAQKEEKPTKDESTKDEL